MPCGRSMNKVTRRIKHVNTNTDMQMHYVHLGDNHMLYASDSPVNIKKKSKRNSLIGVTENKVNNARPPVHKVIQACMLGLETPGTGGIF